MLDHIKELIAQDRLPEAIQALQKLSKDARYSNELIALMARYQALNQHVRADTLSQEEIFKNKNKLRQSLLDLITELEGKDVLSVSNAKNSLNRNHIRALLVGIPLIFLIVVSAVFMFNNTSEAEQSGKNDADGESGIRIETHGDQSPAIIGDDVNIQYGGDFREPEAEEDSLHMEKE